MTFSLSLAQFVEGQRVYQRGRNRFALLTPFFISVMVLFFAWSYWSKRDSTSGFYTLVLAASLIYDHLWTPFRRKERFRLQCNGDSTPPITYVFSEQGFTISGSTGETSLVWGNLKGRLEGRTVWVFLLRVAAKPGFMRLGPKEKLHLLIIPKSATQTPEGAREWAVVDAHFARPVGPPIALP